MPKLNQLLSKTTQTPAAQKRNSGDKPSKKSVTTKLPLDAALEFEAIADEIGVSSHSLRIYLITRFVREYRAGTATVEVERHTISQLKMD